MKATQKYSPVFTVWRLWNAYFQLRETIANNRLTKETEKSSLWRDNRLERSFRNQSCNPVCKKIKNGHIGLNSSESQKPNTMQHPRHLFPKETQGSLSQAIQLPSHPGMNPLLCLGPLAEQYGTTSTAHCRFFSKNLQASKKIYLWPLMISTNDFSRIHYFKKCISSVTKDEIFSESSSKILIRLWICLNK